MQKNKYTVIGEFECDYIPKFDFKLELDEAISELESIKNNFGRPNYDIKTLKLNIRELNDVINKIKNNIGGAE